MNFKIFREKADFSQARRKIGKANVLVYMIGSLGDTIITIPALRAVKRHFPDSNLIVLHDIHLDARVSALSIIPDDLADEYLSYIYYSKSLKKLLEMFRVWRTIRHKKIAAAVYLVPSERSATSVKRDKWFFRACGIQNLIGFRPFTKEELYPVDERQRPAVTENEAIRKLWRLQPDNIKVDEEKDLQPPLVSFTDKELQSVRGWLNEKRQKRKSRLIAICPGCKTIANSWQIENFIEIGRRLLTESDCEIVIAGSLAEHKAGKQMVAAWGTGINACGEFSVRESGALFAQCEFVISLDTGTIHLAAAAGVPCVGIYGERNNPGNWYPIGNQHLIVYHPVECAGCRAEVCPIVEHPCMRGITPNALWKAMQEGGFVNGTGLQRLSKTTRIAV